MTAAASAGRPYLLDTSVILHLVRGNALGQQIQQTYDLIHCQPRPLVSVVSLAEARVLAAAMNWGEAKRQALDTAFRSLTIVNINHPSVIDAYVRLDLHARAHPQVVLLTTDKDFAFLIPTQVQGYVIPSA